MKRALAARRVRGQTASMPIHAAMSSRFPLLEGVPSMQALMEDPRYAQVRAQFESYPDHHVPDVSVRADIAPDRTAPSPSGCTTTVQATARARAWSGCTAVRS
jgi:hypothetical protein